MIPVTNEPMEGEVFDVQDHARRTGTIWTGTHGEMISSDLHGAEEPIRWLLRPVRGAETGQCLIELLHLRRRRTFHQRHFGRARPRGNDPFSVERWPWKAQSAPILTMTSWSFLEADWAAVARVACWRGPWRVNVLLLDASFALKGASTSLEGAFTFITTQLGF
jgi:hypothetical protein